MVPILLFLQLLPLYLQVNSQSLSAERTLLLSLKQQWGNPSSLTGWNSTSSPCDWPEIRCTSAKVAGIDLNGRNLTGAIPPAICQLEDLVTITLSWNQLTGTIPVCLHNLSNLEDLDLSMNTFTGTIPGEFFLTKRLRSLYLNGNRFFGEIPTPIESKSLNYIDLSRNILNGSIPQDITKLRFLVSLDLTMNSLTGPIPSELFVMPVLYYLFLGYNNLSGELPPDMDSQNLRDLNLTHNHLNGTMLRSFGISLHTIDLSYNQLSGDIMETVINLWPRTFRLCSNKFSGRIPEELLENNFDNKCVDFSNLCSDNRSEVLPRCPSTLCSDHRIQRLYSCKRSHNDLARNLIITITVGAFGCTILTYAISYYLARKYWKEKHKKFVMRCKEIFLSKCKRILPSRPDLDQTGKEWEMIPFQKLDFTSGDILSGLTAENLIGKGGAGEVYRVVIHQTGNTVAVKSIINETKSDKRLENEFLAEVQILGTIRHYNIVKLLCCISGKNSKLLVYQYFENQSLDHWLHMRKSDMPTLISSMHLLHWPTRLNIAIGAAHGLCYMHHYCSRPIIHRDIKSSNILLDSEFNAKIADFGLARVLVRHGDPETASAVAGTFGYIAPEYAYTSKVNTKTDVYSFGVVLLELTTGRKAVTRGDDTNLAGWARQYNMERELIIEALDAEIKEPCYLGEMIAVFRLGIICTIKQPSNRPSLKDVLGILQGCSIGSPSGDDATSSVILPRVADVT